jgi:hypothetical protein
LFAKIRVSECYGDFSPTDKSRGGRKHVNSLTAKWKSDKTLTPK